LNPYPVVVPPPPPQRLHNSKNATKIITKMYYEMGTSENKAESIQKENKETEDAGPGKVAEGDSKSTMEEVKQQCGKSRMRSKGRQEQRQTVN
jgi:hypothetical protein